MDVEVRHRVRAIVAEQARIAELVRDLDRRLEQVLAEAERQRAALAPLLEPCGYQLADPGPRGLDRPYSAAPTGVC